MNKDTERTLAGEDMAGCLGTLQFVAAILATGCVLFADVWWVTRVAYIVIGIGMWVGAWRNLTNPWRHIDRKDDDG